MRDSPGSLPAMMPQSSVIITFSMVSTIGILTFFSVTYFSPRNISMLCCQFTTIPLQSLLWIIAMNAIVTAFVIVIFLMTIDLLRGLTFSASLSHYCRQYIHRQKYTYTYTWCSLHLLRLFYHLLQWVFTKTDVL